MTETPRKQPVSDSSKKMAERIFAEAMRAEALVKAQIDSSELGYDLCVSLILCQIVCTNLGIELSELTVDRLAETLEGSKRTIPIGAT